MSADKTSSGQRAQSIGDAKQAQITDDITRIVGFLNSKRSTASERASGLMQELAQRRKEGGSQTALPSKAAAQATAPTPAEKQTELVANLDEVLNNPALAERYHSFCHELDVLLESFRARVEIDKPIKH